MIFHLLRSQIKLLTQEDTRTGRQTDGAIRFVRLTEKGKWGEVEQSLAPSREDNFPRHGILGFSHPVIPVTLFPRFPFKPHHTARRLVSSCLLCLVAMLAYLLLLGTPPALAGLNDDHYDGNIFALYGANGSLLTPRLSLEETLKRHKPALLVFYLDDSKDCKQFSATISQLDAPYGRAASFIPINIDSLPLKSTYEPTEPAYYYEGLVPQTVLIDQNGEVVLNETGQVSYERIDDVFREVFDLLPRSESVELKRRQVNEITTELSKS